ncbi:CAP domain-containing protein [Microvirga makkahensis]|uniref:CAP domain-containing protein n=1 Tax=Microvirga makkahensis TaxID=1128670 RepID=A0A7X3MTZ0_9HYPH|nr:CAP domain-containing protein [Microvirga makkahensis]MXQ13003.1 CAP domain-containing protein [Microvirga makkahensis]
MRVLFISALVALALSGCAGNTSLTGGDAVLASSTSDAAAAARLISAYRASKGLSPVSVDPKLNEAAEYQARVVAAAGKLSHGNFASRMDKFGVMGYAAENLSAGSDTVDGVIGRWKASPGHNVNLLMPQARKIGLARADANNRYGRYWALVLGQ